MSTLKLGLYRIHAVGAGNSLTGVDPFKPSYLPIVIDASVNIWEVKPQPETDYYRLSLVDGPRYTGVEDNLVIATSDGDRDINWLIKYHSELGAYSISYGSFWPVSAWTVSDAEIKIKLYEILPGKDQLFTFEPLDGQ